MRESSERAENAISARQKGSWGILVDKDAIALQYQKYHHMSRHIQDVLERKVESQQRRIAELEAQIESIQTARQHEHPERSMAWLDDDPNRKRADDMYMSWLGGCR